MNTEPAAVRDFLDRARFCDGLYSGLMIGAICFAWYTCFAGWGRGITDLWLTSMAIFLGVMLAGRIHHRRSRAKIDRFLHAVKAENEDRALRMLADSMARATEQHTLLTGRRGASA